MQQLSLFDLDQQSSQPQPKFKEEFTINVIHGLKYIPEYINEVQHDWLLD